MEYIKNLKLGKKITLGFSAVILLLVMTALTGYLGYNLISRDFGQYRQMSNEDTLSSNIQSNLLESRLAFKSFVQTGDEQQHYVFDEKFNKMEATIIQLQESLKDSEMKILTEQIKEDARYYKSGFEKILDYKIRRDNLYNIMNEVGPNTEKSLTTVVDKIYLTKDTDAVYRLGMARRHLILGRLYAARFLENNDFDEVERGIQEFKEFDKWVNLAKSDIINTAGEAALDQVINDKQKYLDTFIELSTVIKERNATIQYMDELGPQITANSEEIKQTLIDKQEEYGPSVNSTIQGLTIIIVIIALMALLLSTLITLGITKVVVKPVETVTNTFKEISHGEANMAVRLKIGTSDEIGHMSMYFNKFMEKLQDIMTHTEEQSWLKTGQAELNNVISGEKDLNVISSNIVSYITKYIGAQIGAIYVKQSDESFLLSGSYAHSNSALSTVILPGDGLVGQAVLENKLTVIDQLPEDYERIRSGIGEALPKQLVIVPCGIGENVKCVLEFGSFDELTKLQLEFLRLVSETIAVSINTSIIRLKMENLLEKTLEQSEELQVQQEELRQSNEELEEQTKALKESEARLQAQQEELRVMNEELSERTKNLEQQRNDMSKKNASLKQAHMEIEEKAKELEIASKYKSEFLANMSHELRTPLNSILVLSQLLANKKDNEPLTSKQLEFAKTINNSGTDLLRLINDILDLSKVEAGKMSINIEKQGIAELLQTLERNFAQIAIDKKLDFKLEINKGVPATIETDGQRLQQILTNLLSNAFKFTERGSVVLKVTTLDNVVSFSVIDTGIGIPTDKQGIIFEAFMQSDGTTSRKFGGTGLGLSISKELTRLLGGKIYLESTEDKGSIFTLVLPVDFKKDETTPRESVVREHDETVAPKEEIRNDEQIFNNKVEGEKNLLIIEDDKVFAEILADLAAEKGYTCSIAYSGENGILLAAKLKPTAIILDIELPGISGWKVIEQLESNPDTSHIPVHVISGHDTIDDKRDAVVGYLRKPVDVENLNVAFEKIEDAVRGHFKKILIVGENDGNEHDVAEIAGVKKLEVIYAKTGREVCNVVLTEDFDCMILDIQLEDMSSYDLLHKLRDELMIRTPAIIYTDKKVSQEEELRLKKYAESIIIKGNRSSERLVAEVNLFLHELDAKKGELKAKPVKTTYEREEALRDRKILIVDDDMRNVFALANVLEDKGMKTVVGRNGIEALEKLNQNTDVDLILMDIMMPEMDGYTAIKEIRKLESFKDLPIIALTAKAMKEDKQKCMEAGASDYLTKPLDIDKLISLIRVWLYQ